MGFRPLVRKAKALSREDCIQVLEQQVRGVLSVIGDGGYPYGVPINHFYDAATGNIYFHGERFGHKIDAIKACDKVSFTAYDEGFRKEGDWALNIRSVVVFGRARFVEDQDRALEICRLLCGKFPCDEEYIEREIARDGKRVLVIELVPEHISGKLVNES